MKAPDAIEALVGQPAVQLNVLSPVSPDTGIVYNTLPFVEGFPGVNWSGIGPIPAWISRGDPSVFGGSLAPITVCQPPLSDYGMESGADGLLDLWAGSCRQLKETRRAA